MLVSGPGGQILLAHALQSVWGRRCLSTPMPAWYPPPPVHSAVGRQTSMCHHTGKVRVCMCVCVCVCVCVRM